VRNWARRYVCAIGFTIKNFLRAAEEFLPPAPEPPLPAVSDALAGFATVLAAPNGGAYDSAKRRAATMMRLIASTVLELIANAIGLLVAYWILRPDFSIDAVSFIIVVAIFTAARFILAPLLWKLSMRYARMLTGGISLVVIFVSLLVTTWLSSGLVITGVTTWILATLIVWVFGVVAMLLLPLVIFKKTLAAARANQPRTPLG